MKRFAHIIVEQLRGHWSAWFAYDSGTRFNGEFPSEAIERLLNGFDASFLPLRITEIQEKSYDGHLEFLVEIRKGIPIPSLN
jgi:hypothetical protein